MRKVLLVLLVIVLVSGCRDTSMDKMSRFPKVPVTRLERVDQIYVNSDWVYIIRDTKTGKEFLVGKYAMEVLDAQDN